MKMEIEGTGQAGGGRTAVNKPSILLICSQTLIREGLFLLLNGDDDLSHIWTCVQINDALERLPDLQPDVIMVVHIWPDDACKRDVRRLKADRPALGISQKRP